MKSERRGLAVLLIASSQFRIETLISILLSPSKTLLGENRQRYLERLKERLERRQKRLEEGLDPDEEDEETLRLLNEEEAASTGNILRDLQNRFDEEKDALLRRLQVLYCIIVSGVGWGGGFHIVLSVYTSMN